MGTWLWIRSSGVTCITHDSRRMDVSERGLSSVPGANSQMLERVIKYEKESQFA